MAELSRYGHRQRMRNLYLAGGMENAPDHNLLELFLSLVIPQKDVKPLAYELINTFGSLENVINADPQDLMAVNGIGESTAVAISLIRDINKRVAQNRNGKFTKLNSTESAIEYCRNILSQEKKEKFLLITLNNEGYVIRYHIFDSGNVNTVSVDVRSTVKYIINDNAAGVIISHNHPGGKSQPSAADINFTIQFRSLVRKINVNFIDHIVVGSGDCTSFACNPQYFYMGD